MNYSACYRWLVLFTEQSTFYPSYNNGPFPVTFSGYWRIEVKLCVKIKIIVLILTENTVCFLGHFWTNKTTPAVKSIFSSEEIKLERGSGFKHGFGEGLLKFIKSYLQICMFTMKASKNYQILVRFREFCFWDICKALTHHLFLMLFCESISC